MEIISQFTAEAKLMNVIRRIFLITSGIRPEDVTEFTDILDKLLLEFYSKVKDRRRVSDKTNTQSLNYLG